MEKGSVSIPQQKKKIHKWLLCVILYCIKERHKPFIILNFAENITQKCSKNERKSESTRKEHKL